MLLLRIPSSREQTHVENVNLHRLVATRRLSRESTSSNALSLLASLISIPARLGEKLAREHVREAPEELSPSWGENTKVLHCPVGGNGLREAPAGDKGVILSAIELLPVPSMEHLERINNAVDTMISPESLREGTFIIEPT